MSNSTPRARPKRSGLTLIALLVILVAAAVGYFVFGVPTAKVAVVTAGKALNAVPGSVLVQAEYAMELKTEAEGRLISSNMDPGKPVKEGEVLAQIDTADLKLDIEHTQSEYEAAKARAKASKETADMEFQTASETLDSNERLFKLGNLPEAEITKLRRAFAGLKIKQELDRAQNEQTIKSFENSLKVKQRQLEKMTVRAPFDGTISAVFARKGDLVNSKASLATLIANSRTVEARISEENFADVRVGQRASVRFLGYGGWLYDATVTKILPTADPDTQRYVVHLNVKIEPEKLVPGTTGEVTIVVGERDAKAIVPRRAIFGKNLFVVKDGRVHLRTVELGYISLTAAEVLSGVTAGEQVIVDQLDQFRDGDRVRAQVVSMK